MQLKLAQPDEPLEMENSCFYVPDINKLLCSESNLVANILSDLPVCTIIGWVRLQVKIAYCPCE
jgi:hypothetical protein